LSATESNSAPLNACCGAEEALSDTALLGLWSRRPRVRVPSLTPFSLPVLMFALPVHRLGVLRGVQIEVACRE
jgi:hypothetical protein